MRIGYFTPTSDGFIDVRNRGRSWRDVAWATGEGHEIEDINALLAPSSSVEQQRNVAVSRAAGAGCELLYMVDSDVWAEGGLQCLFDAVRGASAAGAVVRVRGGKDGKLNVSPVPREAMAVSWVSAACLLVDLHALANLQKPRDIPWFKRLYNDAWTHVTADEGAWFSRVVAQRGGIIRATGEVMTHHRDQIALSYADGQR